MQCPVKAFHCYSKNFHAFPLAAFLISSLVRVFETFRANLSSGKSSFRNVKRAEDLGHTSCFIIATIQYENKEVLFYLYFTLLFKLRFVLILRKIFENLANLRGYQGYKPQLNRCTLWSREWILACPKISSSILNPHSKS